MPSAVLDEAARLDARSIATLFELCERLEMQLIIAAPENISPEKGTTYKLVRKVFNNHEHVHVVGLRGFAAPLPEALPERPTPRDDAAHYWRVSAEKGNVKLPFLLSSLLCQGGIIFSFFTLGKAKAFSSLYTVLKPTNLWAAMCDNRGRDVA